MVEEEQININYPIVKNHQLIQVLPIFRPIKRGARKKAIEKEYTSKDGKKKVTIRMFKELDIADQDLLLAILAIALPVDSGTILSNKPNSELWKKLMTEGIFAQWETISIVTNAYEILSELNKSKNGKNYKWLLESLDRLSLTNLMFDTEEYRGSSNFISYYIEKETKKIKIAINPVNALILLGDNTGYVLHNRKERLALNSDVTKALHAVLVGLVAPNQSKVFKINTLIEKVYLESMENTDKNTKKNRRKAIKQALKSINTLKLWDVEIYDNGTVKVKRIVQ